MIILAIDSTAKIASAAVLSDGDLLAHYEIDNGLTQSELLLPMAEAMLKALGLGFDDVGLYATAVGPGSFTGVRIGTALIKGLAFGKDTPCMAVSTLDELAENLRSLPGVIVPVMNARRDQYYTAIFRSDGDNLTRVAPDMAISVTELIGMLKKEADGEPVYLVGDGYDPAFLSLSEAGLDLRATPPLLRKENAASLGAVAYRQYLDGRQISDRELMPTYLRLPQAERERLERESAKSSAKGEKA